MKKDLRVDLAWGGGMVLLALVGTLARMQGLIDQDTLLRIFLGATGLMVAAYGNRAPKALAPSAYDRQVTRVAGWSLVLSGLLYTGLWVFAPVDLAIIVGTGAIAAGVIVTMGYCVWLRGRERKRKYGDAA